MAVLLRRIGPRAAHGRFVPASYPALAGAQQALDSHRGAEGLQDGAIYSLRRDYGQFDRAQAPDN
jgi:hypothetical protein